MNRKEAKAALEMLSNMFPHSDITKEQSKHVIDKFLSVSPDEAKRAIKAHFDAHQFITWPELWNALDAAKRRQRAGRNPAIGFADAMRQQNPNLRECSEFQVILYVYREWWKRSDRGENARGSWQHRCALSLMGAGMPADTARRYAEKITEQGEAFFKMVLEEVREHRATPEVDECASEIAQSRRELGPECDLSTDEQVIIKKFTAAWDYAKHSSDDDDARTRARCAIYTHAKQTLMKELHQSETDATETARSIVELGEEEELRRPKPFRFRCMAPTPGIDRWKQMKAIELLDKREGSLPSTSAMNLHPKTERQAAA